MKFETSPGSDEICLICFCYGRLRAPGYSELHLERSAHEGRGEIIDERLSLKKEKQRQMRKAKLPAVHMTGRGGAIWVSTVLISALAPTDIALRADVGTSNTSVTSPRTSHVSATSSCTELGKIKRWMGSFNFSFSYEGRDISAGRSPPYVFYESIRGAVSYESELLPRTDSVGSSFPIWYGSNSGSGSYEGRYGYERRYGVEAAGAVIVDPVSPIK